MPGPRTPRRARRAAAAPPQQRRAAVRRRAGRVRPRSAPRSATPAGGGPASTATRTASRRASSRPSASSVVRHTRADVRVLSGIQPTGEKHLGNYVGAIRRWAAEQHEVDAFHPIVDLHAITVPQEPDELRESTLDLAALLIACGLDPDVCTLFVQSHVPEHPRLAWVLECMTPYGEARRMPQFREKSAAQESFSVGLLTYPVLQAADILLYDADVVPVGEDQRQHLELARDLAQRFNQRFGETFVVPEGTYGEVGAKIMDLQEPTSRMSTTFSGDLGLVKVLDPPDVIRRKLRSAVTDSGREVVRSEDKPGVTNLIEIMAVATGEEPEAIEARYDGAGYGKFKEDVGEAVVTLFDPIRLRYGDLRGNPEELQAILARGAEKAHSIAAETLAQAYDRVGFVPP